MFSGSLRDDALLSQGYDLLKRRKKPSTLSISTTYHQEGQIWSPNLNEQHCDNGHGRPEKCKDGQTSNSESADTSPDNSEYESPIELEDYSWVSHAAARRPAATGHSFRCSYHSDDSVITAIDADNNEGASRSTFTFIDAVTFDPEAKDVDGSEFSLDDESEESVERIKFTDVFETEDFTITRTVIRPTYSTNRRPLKTRSFSNFLANGRKSSSSSLKGLKIMRSMPSFSQLGYLGGGGRTMGSFEDDLDTLQRKRELEQQGKLPELRVRIVIEKNRFPEEKWRGAIQALLYSHLPPMITGVSGHIEAVK